MKTKALLLIVPAVSVLLASCSSPHKQKAKAAVMKVLEQQKVEHIVDLEITEILETTIGEVVRETDKMFLDMFNGFINMYQSEADSLKDSTGEDARLNKKRYNVLLESIQHAQQKLEEGKKIIALPFPHGERLCYKVSYDLKQTIPDGNGKPFESIFFDFYCFNKDFTEVISLREYPN